MHPSLQVHVIAGERMYFPPKLFTQSCSFLSKLIQNVYFVPIVQTKSGYMHIQEIITIKVQEDIGFIDEYSHHRMDVLHYSHFFAH
jgi:hypothetical protein